VTDPSFPAVIQMVDVALKSFFVTPAGVPTLRTFRKPSGFSKSARVWTERHP